MFIGRHVISWLLSSKVRWSVTYASRFLPGQIFWSLGICNYMYLIELNLLQMADGRIGTVIVAHLLWGTMYCKHNLQETLNLWQSEPYLIVMANWIESWCWKGPLGLGVLDMLHMQHWHFAVRTIHGYNSHSKQLPPRVLKFNDLGQNNCFYWELTRQSAGWWEHI